MEKLRLYLNSLDPDLQVAFAIACGTTLGSLRTAISKKSLIGPALAVLIERESKGALTRKDLRPDDWYEIWPELIEAA